MVLTRVNFEYGGAGASPHTLMDTTTFQEGDLLVLSVAGKAGNAAPSVSGSWTLADSRTESTLSAKTYYKFQQSGDPSSYDITGDVPFFLAVDLYRDAITPTFAWATRTGHGLLYAGSTGGKDSNTWDFNDGDTGMVAWTAATKFDDGAGVVHVGQALFVEFSGTPPTRTPSIEPHGAAFDSTAPSVSETMRTNGWWYDEPVDAPIPPFFPNPLFIPFKTRLKAYDG